MADVEASENGSHLTVAAGDRVVIRVAENATTGHQWEVAGVTGPLDLESADLVLAQDMAPGAAGERRVVFRARQSGRGVVTLSLQRPWELGEPPAALFSVDVTVT